jgi:hypothetical protein
VWSARSGSIPPEFMQELPVLKLAGLSRADAAALVPGRVADGVVERLVYDTGGNPLGILEIAGRLSDAQRVGAAPLPNALPVGDRLEAVYDQQLTGPVATAWRAVLLSALNRWGTSATVSSALEREGVDLAAALDEAQDQGVLVRQGAEIGFRHPLLRTSVLACATSAEQRSAHRALADVLVSDPLSLAGSGTEPKPPPAQTKSSRRTWHAQRFRAAPGRGTRPHLPPCGRLREDHVEARFPFPRGIGRIIPYGEEG